MAIQEHVNFTDAHAKRNEVDLDAYVKEITSACGEDLVAIYEFGSSFARGADAIRARLLVLVNEIEVKMIEAMAPLAKKARKEGLLLRLDTPHDILRGADVFPVFSLELLDTAKLKHGEDPLAKLEVHPEHLRLHIEQSLRMIHREILKRHLSAIDDGELAKAFRKHGRKTIYLFRALSLVIGVELGEKPTVESVITKVVGKLVSNEHVAVFQRLRRFAGFEDALPHDELVKLEVDVLESLRHLVNAVDQH